MRSQPIHPCPDQRPPVRNHYFTGKLLVERDFEAEQSYHQDKHTRHARLLHGYGTVCGLRVLPLDPPEPHHVRVTSGVALDPWGREIVVPEETVFDLGGRGCLEGLNVFGRAATLYLTLAYVECPTEQIPVLTSPVGGAASEPNRIV